jgi:hypothetical protein
MADFSNPVNSSRSGSSNPFAGPSVAVIRDVPVLERVPIKLSHAAANFFAWKTYFGLLFHEYDLLDHVNGTVDLLAMPHDPDWSTIDATIIRWFFQTVSTDIFHTVVRDGDIPRDVWNKITDLFTDNKLQRMTFLQQEFFGLHQNDLSLDSYCLRLKTLSDELRDLDFPIIDALLLSTLVAGLGEDLSHAASNLTLLTKPTYEQAVAYLRNEERRLPPSSPASTMELPPSRTLSLYNVIVSPALVQNLVSVKCLARDNSVTVEFDNIGFSVKDGRTRMLLHRCDSPGDALYPVQPTSTATNHLALSAGVDLWHARLGHPSSIALVKLCEDFPFLVIKQSLTLVKHVV